MPRRLEAFEIRRILARDVDLEALVGKATNGRLAVVTHLLTQQPGGERLGLANGQPEIMRNARTMRARIDQEGGYVRMVRAAGQASQQARCMASAAGEFTKQLLAACHDGVSGRRRLQGRRVSRERHDPRRQVFGVLTTVMPAQERRSPVATVPARGVTEVGTGERQHVFGLGVRRFVTTHATDTRDHEFGSQFLDSGPRQDVSRGGIHAVTAGGGRRWPHPTAIPVAAGGQQGEQGNQSRTVHGTSLQVPPARRNATCQSSVTCTTSPGETTRTTCGGMPEP